MIEIREKYAFGNLLGKVSDDGIIYVNNSSIARINMKDTNYPYVSYNGVSLSCPYSGSSVRRGGDYIARFDNEGHLYIGVPMSVTGMLQQDYECVIKANTELEMRLGALAACVILDISKKYDDMYKYQEESSRSTGASGQSYTSSSGGSGGGSSTGGAGGFFMSLLCIVGVILFYNYIHIFLFEDMGGIVNVYNQLPLVFSLLYLAGAVIYRFIKGKGNGSFIKGMVTGFLIYLGVGTVMVIFGMVFLSQFGRHKIFGGEANLASWIPMIACLLAGGLIEKTGGESGK